MGVESKLITKFFKKITGTPSRPKFKICTLVCMSHSLCKLCYCVLNLITENFVKRIAWTPKGAF